MPSTTSGVVVLSLSMGSNSPHSGPPSRNWQVVVSIQAPIGWTGPLPRFLVMRLPFWDPSQRLICSVRNDRAPWMLCLHLLTDGMQLPQSIILTLARLKQRELLTRHSSSRILERHSRASKIRVLSKRLSFSTRRVGELERNAGISMSLLSVGPTSWALV